MTDTFRTISRGGHNRPIYWTDRKDVTHICEGADVHRDVRLLWTLCERDVPANTAFLPGDGDKPTCPKCRDLAPRAHHLIGGFR